MVQIEEGGDDMQYTSEEVTRLLQLFQLLETEADRMGDDDASFEASQVSLDIASHNAEGWPLTKDTLGLIAGTLFRVCKSLPQEEVRDLQELHLKTLQMLAK